MLSRRFLLAGLLIALLSIPILITGCPPVEDPLPEEVRKVLFSGGCRGCDPAEGEGEPVEGEGPAEGEGEFPPEGESEGEPPVEGERPPEGEGELPDEGEGEAQEGEAAEGEVAEGETSEGEVFEGEEVEGEVQEGEASEGEAIEGEGEDGSIQVIIEPGEAAEGNAAWRLDEGTWQVSESLLTGVSPGIHTITFSDLLDWVTPEPVEVTVNSGQTAIIVGLYSMTIPLAVERLADITVPAAKAADDLYDAFVTDETRNGFGAALQNLNAAMEAYVAGGGDYLAFCARSEDIPPSTYTEEAVLKRRSDTALSKAKANSLDVPVILTVPNLRCERTLEKSLSFPNVVAYVNGINTDYTDFLKNYRALWNGVQHFAAQYGMVGQGIWNPTGGFLKDLAMECTVQKLLEGVEYWADVNLENETTNYVRTQIEQDVHDGRNVIVVAHSQGNFHLREAIDNMAMETRASINVISAASPASYMPDGLRNRSRVDIMGDPVPDLSLVPTIRFPYEGETGWGTWLARLVNYIPGLQFSADLTEALNRHSFEGAYLRGQAKAAILQRIRDYSRTDGGIQPGEMVSVPAGWFKMGRPETETDYPYDRPVHDVCLDAYKIGKYEVTCQEYADILNWAHARGYVTNPNGTVYTAQYSIYAYGQEISDTRGYSQIAYSDGVFSARSQEGHDGQIFSMANHPMGIVTWYGAVVYCNWLSEQQGLQPCYDTSAWTRYEPVRNGYRLPTEAEWERAAGWDGSKLWLFGTTSDTIDISYANFGGDPPNGETNPLGFLTWPYSTPVGWYNGVNPIKLSEPGSVTINAMSPVSACDMSGNVSEMCHDWYSSTYYGGGTMTNPTGPPSGSEKVLRGGNFGSNQLYICRTFIRQYSSATAYSPTKGFRITQTQ